MCPQLVQGKSLSWSRIFNALMEEHKYVRKGRRNEVTVSRQKEPLGYYGTGKKLPDGCLQSDHEPLLGWEHSSTVVSLCARLIDDGIPSCIFVVRRRVQRFCGMAVPSCYPRRLLLIGTTTSEKLL